jgi:endoglucanase
MKRSKLLTTAICAALALSPALASAQTNSLPVGRCVNMGNHLEPPQEGDWGRAIADDDFQVIAAAGFNTIRLPVRWSAHADEKPPYTIEESFMNRVKQVMFLAREAGLNVILDDHHYEELYKEPETHAPRLAGLWTQIAAEFSDQPTEHVWFEIQNEPHDKLTHANLLDTLAPALSAIRATNPDRPVIIGGELWSGINSLATLPLPGDPHIIPTFHYYDPFPFTHQGATWVDNPPPLGRKYGGAEDQKALEDDVQKIRDYISRTGKTPFMGEFGAIDLIPVVERVQYKKAVRTAFDAVDIGMCAWAYTNTFPLYNSNTKEWLPGMLDAMGLKDN